MLLCQKEYGWMYLFGVPVEFYLDEDFDDDELLPRRSERKALIAAARQRWKTHELEKRFM